LRSDCLQEPSVPIIVAKDHVNGALKGLRKPRQHKRRTEITAMEQHLCSCGIGLLESTIEVGNIIVCIGKNCDLCHRQTALSNFLFNIVPFPLNCKKNVWYKLAFFYYN